MAWKLTLEDINEYKAAFTLFDKDSDGQLSSDEMGVLMRSLGQNFSNKDLKRITEDIDIHGNGIVELHEFLNLMAENRHTNEDQTELIKAFKYFDRDNKGTIDFEEFKHVLTTVSEKLSPEETEHLINVAKVDANGRLNYKDLIELMILR
jgi:calmodulin